MGGPPTSPSPSFKPGSSACGAARNPALPSSSCLYSESSHATPRFDPRLPARPRRLRPLHRNKHSLAGISTLRRPAHVVCLTPPHYEKHRLRLRRLGLCRARPLVRPSLLRGALCGARPDRHRHRRHHRPRAQRGHRPVPQQRPRDREGHRPHRVHRRDRHLRLAGVPAGPVTSRSFYTGLDPAIPPSTVPAGGRVERDINLTNAPATAATGKVVKLDAFVVATSARPTPRPRHQRAALRRQHQERRRHRRPRRCDGRQRRRIHEVPARHHRTTDSDASAATPSPCAASTA
jgi:hypothetical protein